MLTIQNYNKIKNKWFGDWQVGRITELSDLYAFTITKKDGTNGIVGIDRNGKFNDDFTEKVYDIKILIEGNQDTIDDIVYLSSLEDMELFGESLAHYLNTR